MYFLDAYLRENYNFNNSGNEISGFLQILPIIET